MNNSIIKINKQNFLYNIKTIKKECDSEIVAVIKSNGYGHGIKEVAEILKDTNINILGVAFLEEAKLVRKITNRKIFIFNHIDIKKLEREKLNNLIISISDISYLNEIIKSKLVDREDITFHLKVNTGMNRFGIDFSEIDEVIKLINGSNIKIDGIYSHLSNPDDFNFSMTQKSNFDRFINEFALCRINFRYRHIANSGGIFTDKKFHYNMVRPGMSLYGLQPLKSDNINLKNVMTWESNVYSVRDIKGSEYIGYYKNSKNEIKKIAIIPVGYSSGYLYQLGNKGKVLINNQYFNIIGEICMEHIIIDISHSSVKIGDEVILINKEISPSYLANLGNTIQDDVVSKINLDIKRKIILESH